MTLDRNLSAGINTPIKFSHDIVKELQVVLARYDSISQANAMEFRSGSLKGIAELVFPESCHTCFSSSVNISFDHFVNTRRVLVGGKIFPNATASVEFCRPRSMLAIDWESSLFDGAVTPETDGFLDDDCMPGWDSWLALADVPTSYGIKCIVCWVPLMLCEKVNLGIAVDAASCMSWLNVGKDGEVTLAGWGRSIF